MIKMKKRRRKGQRRVMCCLLWLTHEQFDFDAVARPRGKAREGWFELETQPMEAEIRLKPPWG